MNQVAQTILAQLGGSKFCAMTGAKNFVQGPDMLQFDIGKNASRVTRVQVKLVSDLYTMAFYRWNARKLELVAVCPAVNGLFADMLQDTFTAKTGMATRL